MKTAIWSVILLSIATSVYRIAFEPSILRMSDTCKDMAHVFVGCLLGAWASLRFACDKPATDRTRLARTCLVSSIVLTVVEVVCAIARSPGETIRRPHAQRAFAPANDYHGEPLAARRF